MTSQEKIKYLRGYLDLERQIVQLSEELERWRSRAEKVTANMSATGGGGVQSNPMQAALDKITALEDDLAAELQAAVTYRQQVEAAIKSVEDIRLQCILRYRYIEGWTWERIAAAMGLTYVHVCRLHGTVIQNMEEENFKM